MKAEAKREPAPTPEANRFGDEWFTPLRFFIGAALLLLAAYPKVALGIESFFYRDFGVLGYPTIQYARDSFWRGELPLWNPLSNCGAPFLAQWGPMALYPGSIIYLLLPLPWSLSVFCLGHLALGGLGMYFLARRWAGGNFAGTLAGALFIFSGFTLSCLMWPNYTVALGWMPWTVLLAERAWRDGGRWVPLAAGAAAMQMLSGVPEFVLLTWLIISTLFAVEVIRERNWKMPLGRFVLVIALTAGLCAAQLLPFMDLLAHSQRHATFAEEKWAVPWHGMANFFVPLFHYAKTYTGAYFQVGQSLITTYYLGLGAMGLALLGAWRGRDWRPKALAFIALLALVLSLGENGFLYATMKAVAPQLGFVRFPVKFLLPLVFAVPLLAAYGWTWLQERSPEERENFVKALGGWWIAAAGMAAVSLWFANANPLPTDQPADAKQNAIWRLAFLAGAAALVFAEGSATDARQRLFTRVGLIVVLALDVGLHMPKLNPSIPSPLMSANAAMVSQNLNLQPIPGVGRVMITPEAERQFLRSTIPDDQTDFTGKRLGFWSNLNLLDGVAKINGSSTLRIREEEAVQRLIYDEPRQNLPRLADFLGALYETSATNALEWIPRPTRMPIVTGGQLPIFLDGEQTLARMANADFAPEREVFLPSDAEAEIGVKASARVEILESTFNTHRLEIEAEADAPALIVIARTYYHPWQAEVNGEPAKIHRANHAFQAVKIPAGKSHVTLEYRDRKFTLGALISLTTLALCLWLGFRRSARIAPTTA